MKTKLSAGKITNAMSRIARMTSLPLAFALALSPSIGVTAQTHAPQKEKASSATERKQLSDYADDLVRLAREGKLGDANAYEAQAEKVVRALGKSKKNNPVILSESGAARERIVAALAYKISNGEVPQSLVGARLFRLNEEKLFAGATDAATLQQRFSGTLADLRSYKGKAILFVDDFNRLSQMQSGANATLGDLLEAALVRDGVKIIGGDSQNDFRELCARNSALADAMQAVAADGETSDLASDEAEKDSSDTNSEQGFVGSKISDELQDAIQNAQSGERVKVILQSSELQDARLRDYLTANGASFNGDFAHFGAQAIEIPAGAVKGLANLPHVAHVSLDGEVTALGGHLTKTTGADDEREHDQPQPDGTVKSVNVTGAGIGIAVLDSGIYAAHRAFLDRSGTKSRVVYGKDFTGEGRTDDPYGHGTHVASLAAGNGQIAGGAYTGIAPDANIINLRVLNSQGAGSTSYVLNALNWVAANASTYNIKVVNMSLGSPAVNSYRNDPVCRAVRQLVNAGIVVVAAAGNDGKDANGNKVYGHIHSPGNEPSAITVGAVNTFGTDTRADDGVATYSSRGPTRSFWTDSAGAKRYDNLVKPDLVAPGNKLVGADSPGNALVKANPSLDDKVSAQSNADMMTLSGTSMATPVVAGAAALLLQINPKLTPNMIKALLEYTAQPLKGFNTFEQGTGQLNIAGALTLAWLIRPDLSASLPLGAPLFTQQPPAGTQIGSTTIAGFTFPWAQGVILNHTYATGYGLGLYQKVYAQGVLIGDCEVLGRGVILGDTTMISQGVILGDTIFTSNGAALNQGASFAGTGVLIGDGVLVGDGVILGDGVLIGDGVLVGDSVKNSSVQILTGGDNTQMMSVTKDTGTPNYNY